MSGKTIDERVVSMQFDNAQFEKNVQTSMSTLDKLKQKLNLTGAAKGINEINTAAKNTDLNPISKGVETVTARFSAMQIIGMTALANITNQAVNAGKRIVSALTIDPVKTGFQEYETQINAVQTILANTSAKGTTIDDVNRALDELNKYADMTIYNFTEMTRNIGTFTAAGVDLDTSVNAIQGIANLAAVSGSTSQQASTAMYQLSQALAAGTVKLMDWNSVVNAGMGGQVFQDALKETSELLGTGAEAAIKAQGSFRESLTTGWLTAEVLTETLKKFTTTGANEYIAEYTGLTLDRVEAETRAISSAKDQEAAIDAAAEALANASGKNKDTIKETLKFAQTATDAATKVKTFTQLFDVLKESAQSGWSQTWKLIIGDFEEAKNLLTPLADTLTGFINKMSDARNRVLQVALDLAKPWDAITERLGKVKEVTEKVGNLTDQLEYFQDVVNKVWRGDYRNSDTGRYGLLEQAGYDHRVVQDLVNKGYQYKLTVEDIEASHKKFGLTMETTTEETKEVTEAVNDLTDAQLKEAGLTEEEIRLYRALEKEADKLGITVSDLAKEMSENSGRDMLIESFKNLGTVLIDLGSIAKTAYNEIFNPPSLEETGIRLYGVIKSFKNFTAGIKEFTKNTDNVDKLTRTFKGLYAIVKIITSITGGVFKLVWQVASKVLEGFNLNILDVTAVIGDAIVSFQKFLTEGNLITNAVQIAADAIIWLIKKIGELAREFAKLKVVQDVIAWFKEVGTNAIEGLRNGLQNGITEIPKILIDIGKKLLDAIKNVLGIHSPSTEMEEVGENTILGLINGIKSGAGALWDVITDIGKGIINFFKGIDWGKIFAIGLSVGLAVTVYKLAKAVEGIASVFEGFGDILDNTAELINTTRKSITRISKAITTKLYAEAILKFAISLGVIAAAVIALTYYDPAELWNSVAIITVLSGVLVALAWASSKMSDASMSIDKNGLNISGLKSGLLGIAAAILLIGFTVKLLAGLEPHEAEQGFLGLAGIIIAIGAVFAAYGLLVKGKSAQNIDKAGSMMFKLSVSLLLMVGVIKLISGLKPDEMIKGGAAILAFVGVVALLSLITKLTGKGIEKLGGTMIKLTIATGLMVGVIKLISGLSYSDINKGLGVILAFTGVVALLALISKISNNGIQGLGKTLLAISFSMILMIGVIKLISGISYGELVKGGLAILAFVGIIALLTLVVKMAGNSAPKIALTILALSVSIGILAGLAIVLSLIDLAGLAKGVIAIGLLSAMMALMVHATKGANEVKGSIMMMAVAIGIMAIAVSALSFIDPKRLAGATAAMSILMGVFALMIKASGSATKSIGSLIVMTVAIAAFAGVIAHLSKIPFEQAIGAAAALSILVLAVSGAMVILKYASNNIVGALIGVVALTAMAVPMAAFIGLLAWMSGVENATKNAMAISGLMAVMTGLLAILAVIGTIGAIGALIGIVALAAMAGPMAAFIGMLCWMEGIQNATANTELLIAMMSTMTDLLIKISLVAPLAIIGVAAMTGLSLLMVALGALAVGVGALMEKYPQLESFLDTGIPVLIRLAGGIGEMVGAFVSGIMTTIAESLPAIGTSLSEFATNMQTFIAVAGTVDENVLKGVGIMAAAIVALTAADLFAGISSFIQGSSSLSDLGTQLSQFMTNAEPFFTKATSIKPEILDSIKTLVSTIILLTGANLLEAITSFITGESSLEQFGTQIGYLGTGLAQFSTNLGAFTEEQMTTVKFAADAIKTLAQAAATIPNTGGLLADIVGNNDLNVFAAQFPTLGRGLSSFLYNIGTFTDEQVATVKCASEAIKVLAEASAAIPNTGGMLAQLVGDNDLETFAKQFPALGTGIAEFMTNIGTFTDDQLDTVKCAAEAVKALAEVSSTIPNAGGLLAQIVGDNELGTFASQFPALGEGLKGFLDNAGTFGEDQVATLKCAADVVRILAEVASKIPNAGGWLAAIVGDNELGTFADQFPNVGTGIKGFADELGTFEEAKLATVKTGIRAIEALADLAKVDLAGVSTSIGNFGSKIVTFGEKVGKFCSKLAAVDVASLQTAISHVYKVADLIMSLGGINAEAGAKFKKAVKDVGDSGLKKFVEAFTSATAIKNIKDAAVKMINKFIDGLESKEKALKDACKTLASEAQKAISNKKEDFKTAGKDLGKGLVEGIEAKYQAAYDAGYELGRQAAQGEKDGQQSNSPSKLTIQNGKWLGEGLVIGITKMGRAVYNAGYDLGESATKSVSSAVSRIVDMMDSDMDMQPTIRPVLDLSAVTAGAGAVNDIFGMTPSVGVLSNVRTIGGMMNGGRVSANGDVVSAIEDLGRTMPKRYGDSYVINGITYDDTSEVNEAIQTIVRYIQLERRS